MGAILKDILVYLLKNYPHKRDFSNARITKMVYLGDWHQAIHHNMQISNIQWVFDNYGPFVWDVYNEVENNLTLFKIQKNKNIYGQRKFLFQLNNKDYKPKLTALQKESIDHVIKQTQRLNWSDFIKLVYSTYPIMSSDRYSELDLITQAKEYKLILSRDQIL